MKIKTVWTLALVAASMASLGQDSFAQTVRQQRVEARAERQEARQAQRLNNRAQYYPQQTWTQLDPWITRNQVPALGPAARVAANATGRVANAANVAANAAANTAARANAAYGYANPNATGWFYDYYT